MNHWQPELGGGPRGVIDFSGDVTSLKGGAAPNQFNTYASFLLGQTSRMRKALQHIIATGRERQFAFYLTDRYQVTNKLTLNLGIRYENYPLMQRDDGVGIEVYDAQTHSMTVGGLCRSSSGSAIAPWPGPVSTRVSPGCGSIRSMMASISTLSVRKC